MKFKTLDSVVLEHDVPGSNLKAGDLGAVVEACEPDNLLVEFVTPTGHTLALIPLCESEVRAIRDQDVISVRTASRGAA